MPVYSYDPPERFVAGTVGQPGERTFYLQASASGRVTSVALEKFQVSLLAERLDELLDEVRAPHRRSRLGPGLPRPADLADDGPLDLPLMEDFRVGAIALAWDGEDERVVIEAQEETETPVEPLAEEVPENGPGVLRVRITAATARAFSQRALQIVGQGRPALPALRAAARRRGAHLPTAERSPGRQCLTHLRQARAAAARRGRGQRRRPKAVPVRLGGHRSPMDRLARAGTAHPGQPGGGGPAGGRFERHALLHGPAGRPGKRRACTSPWRASARCGTSPLGSAGRAGGGRLRGVPGGGLGLVPPTVFRDGPFGPGMCQLWIDADTSVDLVALARSSDHPPLRDMAVFDAVVNNADRKIGHLLPRQRRPAVRLRPRRLLR